MRAVVILKHAAKKSTDANLYGNEMVLEFRHIAIQIVQSISY